MKSILGILLLSTCLHSHSAPSVPKCYPAFESTYFVSSDAKFGYSSNGYWMYWYCTDIRTSIQTRVVILARKDYGTLSSIAGKITTALQGVTNADASWKRNVLLDTSDPSLKEVYADFKVSLKVIK